MPWTATDPRTQDSAVKAGTVVQIVSADNEVTATYTTAKAVQNVLISAAGEQYAVYTDGTASGT